MRSCTFWNNELSPIRRDLNRVRRMRSFTMSCEYNIIRCVYRAMLFKARRDYIQKVIEKTGDPGVFRLVRQLQARRTLPSMRNSAGDLVSRHADISDLVAAQLGPRDKQQWQPSMIEMDPACELVSAIKRSPANTGPGLDDIGYSFVRYWMKE